MNDNVINLNNKKMLPKKEMKEQIKSYFPRMKKDYDYYLIHPNEEGFPEGLCSGQSFIKAKNTLEYGGWVYFEAVIFDNLFILMPLSHILYKTLKEIYGKADILSMCSGKPDPDGFNEDKGTINYKALMDSKDIFQIEWSYVFKLSESFYLEMTEGYSFPCEIKLWANPDDIKTDSVEMPIEKIKAFFLLLSGIYAIIEKNYSIKNELKRVKSHIPSVTNFYSQHLNSDISILELSEELIIKKEKEAKGILTFGKVDKITPQDDIIKKWQDLRPFRNNLIHANLTKENEETLFIDDHIGFIHNPMFQRNTPKHSKNYTLPRFYTHPQFFQKDVATQTRIAVEDIVANIIEKMDNLEKNWIKSWIHEDSVSVLDL